MITAAEKLHTIFWIPDFQFLHLPNMEASGASVRFIANSQKGSKQQVTSCSAARIP